MNAVDRVVSSEAEELILVDADDVEVGYCSKADCHDGDGILHRAFSIFLFYQFFINIPKDLEEAALVDGASRFRIFWTIIVPLSRPVFATVAILQALANWNRFMWPLMVTRGVEVRPLTVGMQTFFGQDPRLWGDLMAFAAMITIPVLIVFLLFQKWFVQSVASTGIKG